MDPTVALIDLVRRDERFVARLELVRGLGLKDACIGAGAIRNLVWDALHNVCISHASSDVDVVFFDEEEVSVERDREIEQRLRDFDPTTPWEVTNQAGVHLWFKNVFGHPVPPLRSLEEAVASWPEFATCVAVSIGDDDRICVVAPFGLDDLFSTTVRRNPARVSAATYHQRIIDKRYRERWPNVRIVEEPFELSAST